LAVPLQAGAPGRPLGPQGSLLHQRHLPRRRSRRGGGDRGRRPDPPGFRRAPRRARGAAAGGLAAGVGRLRSRARAGPGASSPLQVKLLRALEAGEVKPVGAPKPRRIDVRVVCATHHDLRMRMRDGAFREDLFYRLRGVTVELPPLRARPHDILPLAEHFLPPDRSFSPDARAALLSHRWPGNVRELRHVVQLAALLSESPIIRAYALRFDDPAPAPWAPRVCEQPGDSAVVLRGRTLDELEELAIRSALARHGGNRRAVSEDLGIARSSLLRKLDALRLRG